MGAFHAYSAFSGSWYRQGNTLASQQAQQQTAEWAITEGAGAVTGGVLGGGFKFAASYWRKLRSVKKDIPVTLYTWGGGFGQHSAIGIGDDFFELYYDYSKGANFKNYYNINKNQRPYVTDSDTWEFGWRTENLGKGAETDRFMVSGVTANKMKTGAEQFVSESIGGLKYGEFTNNCSRFCDQVFQAGGLSNGISTKIIGLNSPGGLRLRTRLFIQRIAKYKPE